jgi:hypothetical protein
VGHVRISGRFDDAGSDRKMGSESITEL